MGGAPAALRKAGLAQALRITTDAGDVELLPLKKDTVEGKVKNLSHFKEATSRIYNAAKSLKADQVVVLGGECSIVVGSMLGLTEVFDGRLGMLWMDAHGDFNTPDTSPSGYIGGMCLAMASGRASDLGLEPGGNAPVLGEESLVHVGSRALDPSEVAAFNASPAKLYTAQQVRKSGAPDVAEEAARHLENRSDWIMCHLDLDIIDPEFIPSVNYPTPGGLTTEETRMIIRTLLKTGKLRVVEIAAYNASRDRGASSARKIVELCRSLFD